MSFVVERRKKRRRVRTNSLRVFVCDEHSDVLEEFHRCLRAKRLPNENIRLIHLDAHPDLMAPPTNADVCFEPQALYDALDSSDGGIAEWILPLVFEGHVDDIAWIRPTWSNQLEDGVRTFEVGKSIDTGGLRVSACDSYFTDDHLYAPLERIEDVKQLRLSVSTMSMYIDSIGIKKRSNRSGNLDRPPFVLDVCLDYFVTSNPFETILNEIVGNIDVIRAIKFVYTSPRFKDPARRSLHDVGDRLRDRHAFDRELSVRGLERLRRASRFEFDAKVRRLAVLYGDHDRDVVYDMLTQYLEYVRSAPIDALKCVRRCGPCRKSIDA